MHPVSEGMRLMSLRLHPPSGTKPANSVSVHSECWKKWKRFLKKGSKKVEKFGQHWYLFVVWRDLYDSYEKQTTCQTKAVRDIVGSTTPEKQVLEKDLEGSLLLFSTPCPYDTRPSDALRPCWDAVGHFHTCVIFFPQNEVKPECRFQAQEQPGDLILDALKYNGLDFTSTKPRWGLHQVWKLPALSTTYSRFIP